MIKHEYTIDEAMTQAMLSLQMERRITERLDQIRKEQLALTERLQRMKEARLEIETSH